MFISKYREKDIKWQVIGLNEYNSIKAKLDILKKTKLHTNNLKTTEFTPGCWSEFNYRNLRDQKILIINDNYIIKAYKIKTTVASVNQRQYHKSINALSSIKSKFRELTNKTFKQCFGTVEGKLERCVPKQLYWSKNEPYLGNVSSVDFSSHYPASLCEILPDSHTAIVKSGTIKPTAEYPFAFYVKSGHLAIYKELDTHNWLFNRNLKLEDLFRLKTIKKPDNIKVFDDTFKQYITPDEDETILMKPSKYTLKDVYQHFYDLRKVDPDAKLALNASIGQMHRKIYNRDKYAHLAAIAIARANQKILDLIIKIKFEDIIQIQVDGILYKGGQQYGIFDKYLGAPVQEVLNRPCRWDRLGVYMIDLGDHMKVKCQGYNATTIGIRPEESTKFEDMDSWINIIE